MLKALLLTLCLLTAGCGSPLEDYQQAQPKIDIFNWFNGESRAWGMVQDYSGKQVRRFNVTIHGQVAGDTLTLNEHFVYDDGEKQARVWHIRRQPNGGYVGNAGDIIGSAQGNASGNAFNWRYTMRVKTRDSEYKLNFDDWIYQQDASHLMNVTSMKKFSIEVARVTLFFAKQTELAR
ncbi:lipoprotein, putative [Erwinia amylovora Ea644]|nr:lipoprotein, putative [Erwinia amylovora Ea644]